MKVHTISFVNALILVLFSGWGYLSSHTPSITALIPAILGAILLACNPGIKKENKIIAHLAVVITLIAFAGLFKPLTGVISRGDNLGLFRVAVMMLSTAVALVFFVKSFIDARRKRLG